MPAYKRSDRARDKTIITHSSQNGRSYQTHSNKTTLMTMTMQAIRCHAFAKVVEEQPQDANNNNNNNEEKSAGSSKRRRKKFVVRQQPLPLKDVLSLDTVPSPVPSATGAASLQPNEILIKTKYVGIQYPDYLQTQGLYQVKPSLPYIPGMDVTGIVVRVGQEVKDFTIGDRVMVTLLEDGGTGGLCDYLVVDTTRDDKFIYHVPKSISNLAMISNIGRNYFAAYHSIKTLGQINEESVVLVDGASGGVGMACIELAKAMFGCKCVIAGVSTQEKVQFPYSVGADVVFTYGRTKESYTKFKQDVLHYCNTKLGQPSGVDIVIDMVNGPLFEYGLIGCVKATTGKIILVGFASGIQQLIKPGLVLVKELSVIGSLWGRYATDPTTRQLHTQNVYEILTSIASGKLQPRVNNVFKKKDFIKAFELYDTNTGCGNTVISFNDDEEDDQSPQIRTSKL